MAIDISPVLHSPFYWLIVVALLAILRLICSSVGILAGKDNTVAKAEYVTIAQLLQRLARCESCGYVFQKRDRCFEKRGPDSHLRHCPGCGAATVFHAIALPKQEKEK